MTQKPKLILGTAEFGPKAYGSGRTEPVSLNEIRAILYKAKRGGIKILEGAEDYNCNEILQDLDFDLIYKVRHPYNLNRILDLVKRNTLTGLLYHHSQSSKSYEVFKDPRVMYTGASIYKPEQFTWKEQMIEVPLNIENSEFERMTATCKLVRSVFGRGELLKKYSIKECLEFVVRNPTVHGVIVGVNSAVEMQEILDVYNAL